MNTLYDLMVNVCVCVRLSDRMSPGENLLEGEGQGAVLCRGQFWTAIIRDGLGPAVHQHRHHLTLLEHLLQEA